MDDPLNPKSDEAEKKHKTSPIRPNNPNPVKPKAPARPAKPTPTAPNTADSAAVPTQSVSDALENLSQKLSDLAHEYAEGKINQAQFNAIYRRYTEQREITQRLLERDPQSDAWQSVVTPGHTGFLRDHFAARIISYGIYSLKDGYQVTLQGRVRLPQGQLLPILAKVKSIVEKGHRLGPAWRQLKDNNWVLMIPGAYTIAVVIFSLEPAVQQRKMVQDAHRDFERANDNSLQRDNLDPGGLVFPHRALLEN